MARDFILDTSIVLHYARKSPVFESIEAEYHFLNLAFRPMVCVVTLGEILAIAKRRGWGQQRLHKLETFLANLVAIDIHDPAVINAYAEVSAHATANGWALHSQKNDIWIAAVAHVTRATLLTTDHDFTPAHGVFIQRKLYDNNTGALIE